MAKWKILVFTCYHCGFLSKILCTIYLLSILWSRCEVSPTWKAMIMATFNPMDDRSLVEWVIIWKAHHNFIRQEAVQANRALIVGNTNHNDSFLIDHAHRHVCVNPCSFACCLWWRVWSHGALLMWVFEKCFFINWSTFPLIHEIIGDYGKFLQPRNYLHANIHPVSKFSSQSCEPSSRFLLFSFESCFKTTFSSSEALAFFLCLIVIAM